LGEESLRESVDRHVAAFVRGDIATFASYMTPRALVQLQRVAAGRLRSHAVLAVSDDGATGTSRVRLAQRRPLVLTERWERVDARWRVVVAECAPEAARPLWRRLLPSSAPASNGPA